MQPITEIAAKAGIDDRYLEQYGKYKAKIDYNLLKETDKPDGKLILVTAINPTPAGEGKTTTTVGAPQRRYAETWKERYGGNFVLAIPRTGIRCKRWSSRRRICTGSSDGRHQPSLYR